jgi:hypothetical protein
VQNWVKEMSTPQSENGLGIQGVPESLKTVDQLVQICSAIVSACTMGHAGSFQQYEAYGFVPNYPGVLMKSPPEEKVSLKSASSIPTKPDSLF